MQDEKTPNYKPTYFDFEGRSFEYAVFKFEDGFRYVKRSENSIQMERETATQLQAAKYLLPEGYKIVPVN